MGPVELDMDQKVQLARKWGKNCVQTEPQRYTSHGRRGRGLGVSVCECRGGNLAGEPSHMWGGSAIC